MGWANTRRAEHGGGGCLDHRDVSSLPVTAGGQDEGLAEVLWSQLPCEFGPQFSAHESLAVGKQG